MDRSPQYSRLMRTSIGALAMEREFFTVNSGRDEVKSASSPVIKVRVVRDRPMMVRY